MHKLGTMSVTESGSLQIGEVKAEDLVEEYGTPLLVFDEKELRKNARLYYRTLAESYPGEFRVFYASKAFASRTLYRILDQENLHVEVVSGGELNRALQAEFPSRKIFFHGNNKSREELVMGLENEIGGFFVDNYEEAEMLEKAAEDLNTQTEVMIRLKPGIEAHTHEYIMTGQNDSKFGVGIKDGDARQLIKRLSSSSVLNLTGLHAHIGSQIYEQEAYLKLVEIMFDFMGEIKRDLGLEFSSLNLGGGLGIQQNEKNPEVNVEKHLELISEKVGEEADKRNYQLPEIMVEPGRSIVGTAGTTLYRVGTIKKVSESKKYIAVDGGMADNIRPALYDAEYSAFLANRADEEPVETVSVAGKFCESGDILIDEIDLPRAERGDILAVPATGAYTYPLANNYNEACRPAIVIVNQGQARLIERRETYEDLVRRDVIPPEYR